MDNLAISCRIQTPNWAWSFGAPSVTRRLSPQQEIICASWFRNGGYFIQDVPVTDDAVGQYAVLIGRGASQRINPDGAITGLPYLYGYMMEQGPPNGGIVLAYLQGQRMLANTKIKDDWVDMWGIFQVPAGTKSIRFFLNQALRQGLPHNGSAARFDNLGLYLFATKKEAEAFVGRYH